jgi:hypothetical protein
MPRGLAGEKLIRNANFILRTVARLAVEENGMGFVATGHKF